MQERPFDFSTNPFYRTNAKYIRAISTTVETAMMRMNRRFSARSFSDLCSLENFCLIDIIRKDLLNFYEFGIWIDDFGFTIYDFFDPKKG